MKLLFTYGTLCEGGYNHHFLKTSTLLGKFITTASFTLYDFEAYPAAVEGGNSFIEGEVYKITDVVTVQNLYKLEVFRNKYNNIFRYRF